MANSETWFLQIGINYRGSSAELLGCINDVENVHAFCAREAGLRIDHRAVLTDDTATKPTLGNIRCALELVRAQMAASRAKFKYLLFSYSGHGSQVRDASGDERGADGMDECLVPLDYAAAGGGVILDDELARWLTSLPATECVLLVDACHSGTCVDLGTVGDAWRGVMVSGCRDDQTSADATIAGQAQGAMTACLLEALRKTLDVDAVGYWLTRFVSEKRFAQRPQVAANGCPVFFSGWPRATA